MPFLIDMLPANQLSYLKNPCSPAKQLIIYLLPEAGNKWSKVGHTFGLKLVLHYMYQVTSGLNLVINLG